MFGHDVDLQLEVLEGVFAEIANVKAMAALSVGDDGAVFHRKRAAVLTCFPASKIFAVEERGPAVFGRAEL